MVVSDGLQRHPSWVVGRQVNVSDARGSFHPDNHAMQLPTNIPAKFHNPLTAKQRLTHKDHDR